MTEDPKPGGGRDSMKDSVRRYLEQRSPFSGMTRSELEQVVSEFLRGGDSKNKERVEDVIEEIRARSRRSVDRLTDLVRTEVRKEFESFSPGRREEIGEFFERFVGLLGEYFGSGRRSHDETATKSTRPAAKSVRKAVKKAVKKVPATKVAAKKAVTKAVAAKKTTKAPAKRAGAKKTTSRRPSG